MAQKVVLDTNFFLLPYQNKMDIFAIIDKTVEGKHSYAVSSNTLKELEKIAKNQGRFEDIRVAQKRNRGRNFKTSGRFLDS